MDFVFSFGTTNKTIDPWERENWHKAKLLSGQLNVHLLWSFDSQFVENLRNKNDFQRSIKHLMSFKERFHCILD